MPALGWFLVPYEKRPYQNTYARWLPVPPEVDYWAETDQGDHALVLARGGHAQMRSLFTEVSDPETEWKPLRSLDGNVYPARSLESVVDDVWDDAQLGRVRRLAEALCRDADSEGYRRLQGIPWKEAARILCITGRYGYGLDRVSTGTFPTTSVIETFTGSDSTTPPNGNWANCRDGGTTDKIKITSNTAAPVTSGYCDAYWNAAAFGPDSEAYITLTTKGADTDDETSVYLRLTDQGTANYDLYQFTAWISSGGTDEARIWLAQNGSFTLQGSAISQEWANGEKIGGEAIGSTLTLYRYASGAWSTVGTRTESTLTGAGRIGLQIYQGAGTVRADDFGGGTVVASATQSILFPHRMM